MKRILTYGTFDLLHYGHIRLLQRAKAMGDYLVVALSTDEFNAEKGKKAYHTYETRKKMLEAIRYVDLVIPENSWEQKIHDVQEYHIDTVVMGGDWKGSDKFDYLKYYCELVFLDRTPGISTSQTELSSTLPIFGGVLWLLYVAENRRNYGWNSKKIKSDQEAAAPYGQQDPQAEVLLRLFFKILPSASQVGAD